MSANYPLQVCGLSKHFTLHTQGGVQMAVLDKVSFAVSSGQCLVLDGPSGAGKSTLLRCLYANYLPSAGSIQLRSARSQAVVDLASATPQEIIALRRHTISYVSQFLRVIPRVSVLDIVAEPLTLLGHALDDAHAAARQLLARLNLPERLWHLAPATFSGGEQQRVNIARGLIAPKPVLLLDEPTASLDARNRDVVIDLIREACQGGAAVVGIFHDAEVRQALASHTLPINPVTAMPLAS